MSRRTLTDRLHLRTGSLALALALTAAGLVVATQASAAPPGPTSQLTFGGQNDESSLPAISDDGQVVVFSSTIADLVPGVSGVHLYAMDRTTGGIELVDQADDGTPSDTGNIADFDLSGNGRFVAFTSDSTVFKTDPEDGCTVRVRDGDGYDFEPVPCREVYVRDLEAGTTTLASVSADGSWSDGNSFQPALSEDGGTLVFGSAATRLVAGATTSHGQVYARDLGTGVTTLVSAAPDGSEADANSSQPAISGDGRTVSFASSATNLGVVAPGRLYIRDLAASATTAALPFDLANTASFGATSLSGDGSVLAFETQVALVPEDTNGSWSVYALDRTSGELSSAHPDAVYEDRPQLSADGRFLLFRGQGGTLPQTQPGRSDVYVLDRVTGQTELGATRSDGSPADQGTDSGFSSISGDGRFVAFWSRADDIAPGDDNQYSWDVFVHDRAAPAESASGTGAASTDEEGDGATLLDPTETTVSGSPGQVSITELGGTVTALPTGYSLLGQQVQVSAAPPAPPAYLTLSFRLDSTVVPRSIAGAAVLRNGTVLPDCTSGGDAGPCVAERQVLPDGDWLLVAHSPQASTWTIAAPGPEPADAVPPSIDIRVPVDGAVLRQGDAVTADYSCTDAVDSTPACDGPVPDGTTVDTSAVGPHDFTVTARDRAGNTATKTVHYVVRYRFSGFFAPVDNPPVLNTGKAGDTIPVWFSLGGNQGSDVLAGAPTTAPVTCAAKPTTDALESTISSSSPTLVNIAGLYRYAWRTSKSWAAPKGCRELVLTLKDGTEHRAVFRLK